jgi:hypothetical protein
MSEAKRIEQTNVERQLLAQQYGWQFRPDAPDMVDIWRVLPFTQHGDQRMAFGFLTGAFNGVPFAMFDFHRRPKVTHVHERWTNKKVNELDEITIDSVWAVKLPSPLPYFQIASSTDSAFEVEGYPEPPTPDKKFNRWYRMIDTDPGVAGTILHPRLAEFMRKAKVHTWAISGNDLVATEHPIFGRTKPDDVLETLGKLVQLAQLLPYQAFHA